MKNDAPEILALRAKVTAANEELHFAIACREAWKPAAFNTELLARIGTSYAGNTFLTVRQALEREMLLALLRLWDEDKRSLGMVAIGNALANGRIMDALIAQSADKWPDDGYKDQMQAAVGRELREQADVAIAIINKYKEGGISHGTLKTLKTLRNEHWAHRQINPTLAHVDREEFSEGVDQFYQDMALVVRTLLHVVERTAFDPQQAENVYANYAALFWAPVCGERTEGHPDYRPAAMPPRSAGG